MMIQRGKGGDKRSEGDSRPSPVVIGSNTAAPAKPNADRLSFVSWNRFDDGVLLRVVGATKAAAGKRWIHVVEVVREAGR